MSEPWRTDEYDPELHGVPEQEPKSAQRWMAAAITLAAIALPAWGIAVLFNFVRRFIG